VADDSARSDEQATVRDGGVAHAEPHWPGQTHQRGKLLGRYVVLSLLGSGGMGEVYTAFDPALDRRVALKVIKPFADDKSVTSARGLLLAEAQALAKVAHPHVITVYDVGTFDDDVYLAMEYVEGTTLAGWLDTSHSWTEIVDMFVAAGRGLEAAHRAGLVHRDFKPHNVLIGKDDRVRVIDFGIALANKARATPGEIVGTPAFMAPEQFEAGDVGPAADQFAFCVALYQALWHQHAFAGDSDADLRDNVLGGKITPPPTSDVPTPVRDAIVRGLSRDPAARHPAMGALLDAIKPRPRRRFLPYALAGGASAIAAATVLVLALPDQEASKPCAGFERDLAGTWDPARKRAVQDKVAPDAWPTVERFFDDYSSAWVQHKIGACRASSVTHEQTPAVLERRMSCLDTRRRELDAAVAIVAGGGAPSGKVHEIASGLRSLASCDNLAALAPLPQAPAASLRAVEDQLARVHAKRLAGNYAEARQDASLVIAMAKELHWGAAIARALVQRGLAETVDGDPKAARETLFEAIRQGEEAGDVESQATAWVGLVSVEASGLRQPTEALRWAKHAEIALAKAGGDQEEQAQLLHNVASALRTLDRDEEALDHERRALALFEHAFGPRHARVANQRGSVATSLRRVGQLDESIRENEAALALLIELVGDRHPYVASQLNNLGLAYDDADRLADARRVLEQALEIREAELGKTHASIANPLMNLVALERRAGNVDAAEALWQRAYDIRVATLGEGHPDVTRALHGKLIDRVSRGVDDEARTLATEVVARLRSRADAVELATALSQRCELERRAGRLDAAQASCKEAVAALGKDPEPTRAVYVYAYVARVATQRLQLADAEASLERARAALATVTRDRPVAQGYVAWAAAHLALAAGKRDEAIQLAHDAREALMAHGKNFTYVVSDLDRVK
jgi:eukaryotic-like serine/threonine-protein kinase